MVGNHEAMFDAAKARVEALRAKQARLHADMRRLREQGREGGFSHVCAMREERDTADALRAAVGDLYRIANAWERAS